jgi:hypothetical protein
MKLYNDAINICLTTIGESPVPSTTSIVGHYEAELAETIIGEAKTEVLAEGFQFNTDDDWTLVPDTAGYITIPADVISIDGTSRGDDLIERAGKLYDKARNSYIFTTPQALSIVWDMTFDTLPIPMQSVVVASAKLKLYTRVVGVDAMVTQLERELQTTRSLMITEDLRSGDYSIFDETSTTRVMSRGQNPSAL